MQNKSSDSSDPDLEALKISWISGVPVTERIDLFQWGRVWQISSAEKAFVKNSDITESLFSKQNRKT